MAVQVQCPNCGKNAAVRSSHLGRTIRCTGCQGTFTPEAAGEGAAAALAAASAKETAGPPADEGPGSTAPDASGEGSAAAPKAGSAEETAGPPAAKGPRTSATTNEVFEKKRTGPAAGQPGHIGRFQVLARLGAGAFGTVYRANDPQLEREVALKVPQAGAMESRRAVERFLREAKAAARLQHPHIVPVYDAGRDGPHYYIASAFIKGKTLSRAADDGKVGFRQAAQIVRDLAEALGYAHGMGVRHRDVKSSNVMLDEQGQAHLMDFGLAAMQDESKNLTNEGALLGTPAYMAPEQAKGKSGEALPASDQYSLGVILYELLCGDLPFSGPVEVVLFNAIHQEPRAPRSLRKDVPPELEIICLKAMSKRPEGRYASCQELADDLRRWLEGEPIKARRLGPVQRLVRWCRREPRQAVAAAAVAFCLVAVAVVSLVAATRMAEAAESEREARKEADKKTEELRIEETRTRKAQEKEVAALKQSIDDQKEKAEAVEQRAEALKASEASLKQAAVESEAKRKALEAKAEQEAKNRHLLYDAHFKLALREWDGARILDAQRLLGGLDPALRDWEWRYLQRLASRPSLQTLDHKGAPVNAVAFSPDGRKVASATEDGKVTVWDLETGKAVFELPVPRVAARAVAFAPKDGGLLASAWADGKVRVSDWGANDTFLIPASSTSAPATCLAFHPKNALLATGSADRTVKLWSLAKNKADPVTLPGSRHTMPVSGLAFSPGDGRFLISASLGEEADVKAWDFDLWEKSKPFPPELLKAVWPSGVYEPFSFASGHHGGIRCLSFHPKGNEVALGSPDHSVTVVRFKFKQADVLGQKISLIVNPELFFMGDGHQDAVNGVVYLPGGDDRFATASADRTVKVWDRNQSVPIFAFKGHLAEVRGLTVSPDGTRLASASADGTVKVWDLTSRQEAVLLPAEGRLPVQAVAFSPVAAGQYLAFGGGWPDRMGGKIKDKPDKGDLRIWDARAGKATGLPGHTQGVTSVAFGLDGETLRLASASHDGKVKVWDAKAGKLLFTLSPEQGRVNGVAFSPDGKRLASAGQDGSVKLWDAATPGNPVLEFPKQASPALAVAFSPDGKLLASSGQDGAVRLWDAASGKGARPPLAHGGVVYGVAFSPDGKTLASAASDKTVKLWECKTGALALELKGHSNAVMGVAFSADGKRLASASTDWTVKVWDVKTGQDVLTLPALSTDAMGVAFSPDGRRLAVADYAGSADVYDAAPDDKPEPKASGDGK